MKVIYNNYFLRKITKHSDEIINNKSITSVKMLINYLIDNYNDKIVKYLIDQKSNKLKAIILINGVSISDLDYKIYDDDIINIFQLVGGG
ncbi:MAG: MoaD/ThiS family protein [Actinomycetota bacterium]|nr:MoaD/ThiS family protein [Actinomycetota bacterium]